MTDPIRRSQAEHWNLISLVVAILILALVVVALYRGAPPPRGGPSGSDPPAPQPADPPSTAPR